MKMLMNFVLVGLVVMSALAVVYTKHQTRKLFVELDGYMKQRDELNVEWGRLQLEQSTLNTHGRIEEAARTHLKMVLPEYQNILIIEP